MNNDLDLIRRLRTAAENARLLHHDGTAALHDEAADEIERMRTGISDCLITADLLDDNLSAMKDRLQARQERLAVARTTLASKS
jgi:hypothetical protein